MRMILTDINLHRRVIRLVHGSGWVLNDNKWCPATCLTVVNMERSDFTSIYIERRQGRLKLANNNISCAWWWWWWWCSYNYFPLTILTTIWRIILLWALIWTQIHSDTSMDGWLEDGNPWTNRDLFVIGMNCKFIDHHQGTMRNSPLMASWWLVFSSSWSCMLGCQEFVVNNDMHCVFDEWSGGYNIVARQRREILAASSELKIKNTRQEFVANCLHVCCCVIQIE